MRDLVTWQLGAHDPDGESPRKVQFFWQRSGTVWRAAEFGLFELEAEIRHLKEGDGEAAAFRAAHAALLNAPRRAASGRSGLQLVD